MIKRLICILLFLVVITGCERMVANNQQNIQGKITTTEMRNKEPIISSKTEEITESNPKLYNGP